MRPKEKQKEADAVHNRFKVPSSDALTFLKVWRVYEEAKFSGAWCFENFLNAKSLQEVRKIRTQLFEILSREGMKLAESKDQDAIAKAVSVGLAYNLFEHTERQWYAGVLRPNSKVAIHPSSAVFGNFGLRFVVVTEIVRTTKVWARGCTEVKAEWLPEIVPTMCKLGEPLLDSYTPGEDWVAVRKPILFRGKIVGDVKSKVTISEAVRIQEERIRGAVASNLIPLSFTAPDGRYSFTDWVAELNGVFYKSWSHVKEGATYYCTIEDFIGRKYARPVFEVFDLPRPGEKTISVADVPSSALGKLAKQWGARLK